MSTFTVGPDRLEWSYDGHKLRIEPWGANSLRVRATQLSDFKDEDWALMPVETPQGVETSRLEDGARIVNGNISAVVNERGQLSFYNQDGKLLLEEFWRMRDTSGLPEDPSTKYFSPLTLPARDFKPLGSDKYELRARFEAQPGEKIYGMGQYQQPFLDVKGCTLELAQRNSQASVPFMTSSRGYGLLWNNPAVGEVNFATNQTTWMARMTTQMDYWITAGDTPAEISRQYAAVTGKPPMLPDYASGFWQCKLRYRTQEELLGIAREYKKRGLPLSVIVADFFHWPNQGEWRFDPVDWPDPKAMVDELKDMGVELMVSIWPTVDDRTENYKIMKDKGYLVKTERGVPVNMTFLGNTTFFDATHPGARKYVWEQAKKNYHDLGIKIFWLDEAEPNTASTISKTTATTSVRCSKSAISIRAATLRPSMRACRKRGRPRLSISCAAPGPGANAMAPWSGRETSLPPSRPCATSSWLVSTWAWRVFRGGPPISAGSTAAISTIRPSRNC